MEFSKDRKAYLDTANKLLADGNQLDAKCMYETVLEHDAKQVTALRALARIATSENDSQQAVLHWNEVKRVRPDVRETSLRLGRLYKKLKQFSNAVKAYEDYLLIDPDHAEAKKVLPGLITMALHETADPTLSHYQHVAIAGVSYCGSTLLARILGGLRGVENIGESHWLINKRDTGSGSAVDFDNDDDQTIVNCFSCGSSCKALTRDFRKTLQQDPVDWYFKIAEKLKCKTIVSADKNHVKLIKHDPALRMDAIILFKSPLQAWYSNYRKINLASSSMSPITDIDKYMKVWADSYHKFLDEFDNRDDKLFLSFDDFCIDPSAHLQKLCNALGMPFDEAVLASVSDGQHSFGGNSGVNKELRKDDHVFSVKALPVLDLPQEHIHAIDANKHVQSVYQRLMTHYRRDFPIVDPVIEKIQKSFPPLKVA